MTLLQWLGVRRPTGCGAEQPMTAQLKALTNRPRCRWVCISCVSAGCRYGKALLVHFEDFASRNSYRLLAKYREQVPTSRSIAT